MSKMYEKLQKCVSVIRGKTDFVPEVALILGSGLGEYAKNMDVKRRFLILRSKAFRYLPLQVMTAVSFLDMLEKFPWSL